jgi:adenylate cyclase
MQQYVNEVKAEKIAANEPYFDLKIGINTGPVVAGVVGVNKFAYDIWGDTVNIASRMEQNCEPGQVNISETTYWAVKYNFKCLHRGKIDAKNKGQIDMYYIQGII